MRPRLLFLSPRTPAITGGAPAMRAGIALEVLAERYDVFLLIFPAYGRADEPEPSLRCLCKQVVVTLPPAMGRSLPDPELLFPGVRFEAVYVSRLLAAPIANSYLMDDGASAPFCCLDLDDFESHTRLRIAGLYEARGDTESAERERETAAQFAELERHYLPIFDCVWACSDIDRRRLSDLYPSTAHLRILPNAIRSPQALPCTSGADSFTFLFVGDLLYYPNQDAVTFFCRSILPEVKRRSSRPLRFVVAGRRPPPEMVAECSEHPDVFLIPDAPDLSPHYASSDAVVAPIRAGGGTRVKILEACGHRRPVVSTGMGAEGLDVTSGRELLLAETAQEFAEACLLLIRDREAADRIAAAGYDWVLHNHTVQNVRQALAAMPGRSRASESLA